MLGRVIVLVAVALGPVACDHGDAIGLGEWTLRHDGQELYVELPGVLPLPDREVEWTLERDVTVPDAWRGRALTLVIPLYAGPSFRVTVDGVEAPALDDGATASAYRVPASPAATRHLVLARRHGHFLDAVVPVRPRLSATSRGDPAYVASATFTRWAIVLTIGLGVMVTFIYAASWLLDRRPAHGWFALQTLSAVYFLAAAYAVRAPAWPLVIQTAPLVTALVVVTGAAFLHAHFALGRMPRGIVALAPLALCMTIGAIVQPFHHRWFLLFQALLVAGVAYNLWILVRVMRDPRNAADARLFAIAWLGTIALAAVDGTTFFGFAIVPVPAMPVALAAYALIQSFVVTRDRVRRMREVEGLNVELRRQVADRSRELADALAGSAVSNAPVALDTIVEDRYRVLRQLGAGAMGAVYEVERLADGRHLALKVITMRATGDVLARFAREAQIAASLDAPNLVAVLDVGVSRSLGLFLVMELVTGGSLDRQVTRFGDVAWARPLCGQIAAGLAVMHAAGVLHRDLKPANVMLTAADPPRAKIADFGLAGLNARAPIDGQADTAAALLTQAGAFLGTPVYMAPELARGAEHASPASDVFALGVLAHELLAGAPPFGEPAVILAQRGVALPRPAGSVPDVIARCLDEDPSRRPSAAEVRDQLI